jgi:SAM-dependent methyltransferase
LPFQSYVFDFVVAIDVIEHVKLPGACLSEIRRALKEKGLLYFEVPNRLHFTLFRESHTNARDRLKERMINEDEVENVLNNPKTTYFDMLTEHFVSIGPRTSKPGHWLIVVYETRDRLRRVISILDTSTVEEIAHSREVKGRWLKVR